MNPMNQMQMGYPNQNQQMGQMGMQGGGFNQFYLNNKLFLE